MKITTDYALALGLVPLRVYDRNGREIEERIIEFDTKTGEVKFLATDENGSLIIEYFESYRAKVVIKKFPPPLRWIPDKLLAKQNET
jgi:hypothetical protein